MSYFTSYGEQIAFFGSRGNWPLIIALAAIIYAVVPAMASDYFLGAIIVPVLIMAIAALGLNLLMGYAGQPSLGTGGLMAVGAYVCYKLISNIPDLPFVLDLVIGGAAAAVVGVIFGLTSLKLKAFYLAIATLAAQFFLEWTFSKVAWFWNYSTSGIISTPSLMFFGISLDSKINAYLFVLTITLLLTALAHNLLRSHTGRRWIAIRDNDIAAEIIGVNIPMAKLSVFAVSSFYCGIAGGLWAFIHLQSVTITAFTMEISLKVMFMVIVGGMGSLIGCFLGSAFIFLVPLILNAIPQALGISMSTESRSFLEQILFGVLIIFFLIVERNGLAKLVHWAKDRLRSWPYPYEG
jgi:branched-chain amino acid transport system permease protein